jgi:murein DD-endopeptidase MepM/ murein hydrolase activator NlpD
MKKFTMWLFVLILSSIVFLLGFNTKTNLEPKYLYQVYLDDQVLGVIKSKTELEEYIDNQGSTLKEKYNVDKVYAPEGLEIRRIITYDNHVDKVEDVYEKLSELKPFTISGYQFTIKKEVETSDGETVTKNTVVYVTDASIFETAIQNTIISFIGEDVYKAYREDTQTKIKETGLTYNDIYVDNDITKKQTNISVNEKIYVDSEELSQYILFSTNENKNQYVVKSGDTIESVANANKISIQEFLISNPEFTSKDNILYAGQVVSVAYANPLVDVMADVTKIEDQTTYFTVQEQSSNDIILGDEQVVQEGENGINRVTQNIRYKNGFIQAAEVSQQVEIKPTTAKIVLVGTKYISGVGGNYWTWPTSSYSISSSFGWRSYEYHTGLDIYNYYGAPIYAANNGVVTNAGWYGTYGIFVGINHNNGYGTGYGHMSSLAPGIHVGSVVERGQIIGYIGLTGQTTGPHVHFELYYGSTHPGYNYSRFLNPYYLY